MDEKKSIKISLGTAIALIIIVILALILAFSIFYFNEKLNEAEKKLAEKENNTKIENEVSENVSTNVKNSYKYIDYTKKGYINLDYDLEVVKPSNTIRYALLKKYGENYDIFEKYNSKYCPGGDSQILDIIESSTGNTDGEIGIISGVIEFNMAKVKYYIFPNDGESITLSEENLRTFASNLKKERQKYNSMGGYNNNEPYEVLNGISIMNGNNNSEDLYNSFSRAKKIEIIVDNDLVKTFDLEDTNEVQTFDINYEHTDISKPINVKIKVLETYPGTSDDCMISEIGFGMSENGYGGI